MTSDMETEQLQEKGQPQGNLENVENQIMGRNDTRLIRRSHLEIFCDILRAVGSGAERPTHIMYKANLSWDVLQSYLKTLQSQDLIEAQATEGRRTYRLSKKGYEILKQFISIRQDLNF
jgi:predicted transcriptional regulator